MTRNLLSITAAAMLAITSVGCMSTPDDGDDSLPDQELQTGDEGIPGEDPANRGDDKAANRVYVQWCDQPNSARGTICQLYGSNLMTYADMDECRSDVRRVCGNPVEYFNICDRAGCVYLGR